MRDLREQTVERDARFTARFWKLGNTSVAIHRRDGAHGEHSMTIDAANSSPRNPFGTMDVAQPNDAENA